jgi:hypothetical protein
MCAYLLILLTMQAVACTRVKITYISAADSEAVTQQVRQPGQRLGQMLGWCTGNKPCG